MSKQTKHENRKSFKNWAQPGQLTEAVTTKAHVKASASNKDGAFSIPLLRHINRKHSPQGNTPFCQMASKQINFGPRSILSRSQNKFGKDNIRPSCRYVLAVTVGNRPMYRQMPSGQILSLRPKVARGKAGRRQMLRDRREDRALAAANLDAAMNS